MRPKSEFSLLMHIHKNKIGEISYESLSGMLTVRFSSEFDYDNAISNIDITPVSNDHIEDDPMGTGFKRFIIWDLLDIRSRDKQGPLEPYIPGHGKAKAIRTEVNEQEDDAAELIGGRRHIGSGAIKDLKSDASSDKWQLEAKSTSARSIRITLDVLQKIYDEAAVQDRDPVLHIRFREMPLGFSIDRDWVLIQSGLFRETFTK